MLPSAVVYIALYTEALDLVADAALLRTFAKISINCRHFVM